MSIRNSVIGLLVAACAAMSLVAAPGRSALASSTLEIDPERVRWTRLSFQASHRLTRVRSDFGLAAVAAAQLKDALLTVADGSSSTVAAEHATLMTATITMTSKLPLVDDKVWETRVWFLPETASPLQRTRTKLGADHDRKIYRYLADGVRRLRQEAGDPVDGGRQPDKWTTVQSAFYAYGPARGDCRIVSDPSLLLYVLSAIGPSAGDPPLELCVFNKKTLHRVELRAAGSARLPVHYAQRRGATVETVDQEISVLTAVMSSRPIAPADQETEPFEFFEMRGDVEVSWDPTARLPVRVRGTVDNVGEAAFDLIEADLAR